MRLLLILLLLGMPVHAQELDYVLHPGQPGASGNSGQAGVGPNAGSGGAGGAGGQGGDASVEIIEVPAPTNLLQDQTVNTQLDKLHDDLNGVVTTPSTQTHDDNQTTFNAALQSAVTRQAPTFGWLPLFPSCTCSPWVLNYLTIQSSFDWCPYVEKIKGYLSWIMYLLTGWLLTSLLTRKPL